MGAWQSIRSVLLVAALVGVGSGLASALIHPKPLERPLTPVVFEGTEPVPDWGMSTTPPYDESEGVRATYRSDGGFGTAEVQLRYSGDIRSQHTAGPELVSRFVPAGYIPLDVRTRYLVTGHGKIKANSTDATLASDSVEMEGADTNAPHCFWNEGRLMHMSALVFPGGGSAVTRDQFSRRVYRDQLHWQLLQRWAAGEVHFPDTRCIVVDISVRATRPQSTARQELERAWSAWYPWCVARFAQPQSVGDSAAQ